MNKELVNKLFDYSNGKLFWKSKFSKYSNIKIGQEAGCFDNEGYQRTKINKIVYPNHRLIFLMFHGYMPKKIDHINKNKSDNRIENLRKATDSQNQHNRTVSKNNTSGVKNVSWSKRIKKWQVIVMLNNKYNHCGYYSDIELADLVAQEARNKYHKEFASC